MMHFAAIAARFCPRSEIIELHHDAKLDAPSGTAIKTAEMITATRNEAAPERQSLEKIEGARGADKDGVRLHSVRLPGLVAHQDARPRGAGPFDQARFVCALLVHAGCSPGHAGGPGRPGVTYGLERLLGL